MVYYQARKLRILGIAQMVIACLMFVLGVVSLVIVPYWSSSIACGLWVGIWVGLTGLFCYLGAKSDDNPFRCLIGVMIGFAVTGCILTGIMLIIQSIVLVEFASRLRCPEDEYPTLDYLMHHDISECNERYNRYMTYPSISTAQTGAVLTSLLIILAVVEFFVALASSFYGCNACCCTSTPGQTQHQVAYLHQPGGNMIIITPPGGFHPGSTLQAVGTYPGQPPVVHGGQPRKGYIVSPQVFQAQPNSALPASNTLATEAPGYIHGQQVQQDPQNNPEDLPPSYESATQQ